MGKPKAKLWFAARRDADEIVDYVICAATREKAVALLGCLAKHYTVSILTWQELSDLVNCIIPEAMNKDGVAAGELVFYKDGGFFTLKFSES